MRKELTSEERMRLALQHKEPDRVPFDLGGTLCTGIMVPAYRSFLPCIGISRESIPVVDMVQQLAEVDEDVLEKLKVDTRALIPTTLAGKGPEINEDKNYRYFTDSWGIGWRMPKEGGYYYDMYEHPLKGNIDKATVDRYPWPDPAELIVDIRNLKQKAQECKEKAKASVVSSVGGGFFEIGFCLINLILPFF